MTNAGLFEEGGKHLERLLLQAEPKPLLAEFPGAQIDLERAEPSHLP